VSGRPGAISGVGGSSATGGAVTGVSLPAGNGSGGAGCGGGGSSLRVSSRSGPGRTVAVAVAVAPLTRAQALDKYDLG
jgi:hypothetical protein